MYKCMILRPVRRGVITFIQRKVHKRPGAYTRWSLTKNNIVNYVILTYKNNYKPTKDKITIDNGKHIQEETNQKFYFTWPHLFYTEGVFAYIY